LRQQNQPNFVASSSRCEKGKNSSFLKKHHLSLIGNQTRKSPLTAASYVDEKLSSSTAKVDKRQKRFYGFGVTNARLSCFVEYDSQHFFCCQSIQTTELWMMLNKKSG